MPRICRLRHTVVTGEAVQPREIPEVYLAQGAPYRTEWRALSFPYLSHSRDLTYIGVGGIFGSREISVRGKASNLAGKSGAARVARQAKGICACDAQETRKAVAVDPEIKAANRHRLRRIEGQIRGLQKMVDDDRYCADIITQIASVQEALRGVARNLMRNHLHHCATKALRSGKKEEARAMYDELLELIYAHLR